MTCGCTKMKKKKQKRLQARGNRERMRKWLGHYQETCQNGQTGKTREREESEWRLEPEGEAEVQEIIVVSDAVEGTFVDLDGESRREQVEANLSKRGREILNEGEEIKKSKKESDSDGIRRNT